MCMVVRQFPGRQPMARYAIVFGILLIAVGLAGYFGTDTTSRTPLIPAGLGGLLVVLGLLALKDSLRKHAMHAAAMVGLIGFLGGAYRLVEPLKKLSAGEQLPRPIAALMTAL